MTIASVKGPDKHWEQAGMESAMPRPDCRTMIATMVLMPNRNSAFTAIWDMWSVERTPALTSFRSHYGGEAFRRYCLRHFVPFDHSMAPS
jgi:hypothetical protein